MVAKGQPLLANADRRRSMALSIGRSTCLMLGVVLTAACGNGDDLNPGTEREPLPTEPVEILPARPTPASIAGGGAGNGGTPAVPSAPEDEEVEPPKGPGALDPNACATPNGVNGRPTTLQEAIILMNSLPRPTSLACFVQALERPLSVYMTSSGFSLQPSPGERSPRTFFVNEPLVMSIVLDGPAQNALELGYRTTETRSIKTEILFPLESDVTYGNFFDEVLEGEGTKCGR